jgi:hypothetical protein
MTQSHGEPRRFQRSRRKGHREPQGVIYVGRPTVYGNPHRVEGIAPRGTPVNDEHRRIAVQRYEDDLLHGRLQVSVDDVKRELRGRHLSCWCALGSPCHADVLLRHANR